MIMKIKHYMSVKNAMEWKDLPDDIIISITENLSILDILRYSQIDKRVYQLCQEPYIWKQLITDEFANSANTVPSDITVKQYYIDLYKCERSIPVYLNAGIYTSVLALDHFKIDKYIDQLCQLITSEKYIIIFRNERKVLSLYVHCNNGKKLLELHDGNIDNIVIYDGEGEEYTEINNEMFNPLVDKVLEDECTDTEYIYKQCMCIIIRIGNIIVNKAYGDARTRCRNKERIVLNNTVAYFIHMIEHLYVLQFDSFKMCESMNMGALIDLLWLYKVMPANVHEEIGDNNKFNKVWENCGMGKVEMCEYLTNVLRKREQLICM